MQKQVISVTEAARNFAECVNRAHYQNVTFVLVKNGLPMAQIVPHHEPRCTGQQLAEALRSIALSPANARAWQRDLRKARKSLRPPVDRWR